jgi:replicative DNA helicase
MVLKYGIKGAVVDYMQIMNVNQQNQNKEQAMATAARLFKNIAKDLNIWVVALSQLSRNNDRPEPSLSRLRDSGQIAEAADVVILVYRPEAKSESLRYSGSYSNVSTKGTALIDVAKGRNIGIFKFMCGFNAETTTFYPIDNTQLPQQSEVIERRAEKDPPVITLRDLPF